jgi:predicted DsbA family dithiol-disulfide isomerase
MRHHRSGRIKQRSGLPDGCLGRSHDVVLPRPAPGTIAVWTDIACGWSTLALHRLYAVRNALGLRDDVTVDPQLFFLEDVNKAPMSQRVHDAEISVFMELQPDLGWSHWPSGSAPWPVTTALANEAVHAAKAQSPRAAEELDMALRLASFRDTRCISLLHEVLAAAEKCVAVDVAALAAALDDGRARGPMMRAYRDWVDDVQGSPHFVFADGYEVHNPGTELHWEGEPGKRVPVVDKDDPSVYEDLVRRAARR